MSKKVKVDDLSKAILEELKNYEGVTEEAAWKGVSDTSKTALQKLSYEDEAFCFITRF